MTTGSEATDMGISFQSLLDPAWLIAAAVVILAGLAVWHPAFRPRTRDGGARSSWLSLVGSARLPLMLLVMVVLLRVFATTLDAFTNNSRPAWDLAFRVAIIVLLTVSLFMLIEGLERVMLGRYDISVSDNLRARQMHTQLRVLSRTAQVALVVIGVGVLLMSFDAGRKFGASLLASAGIASLAIGLAARPALESLIAGIQIALTQPIRIDDVVIVDGEWGRIEEIAATFVIMRIWDDRRLVIPLNYFLNNTFQNWTRTTAKLLGTVYIRCDHRVDVDAVRAELTRLCQDDENWDKRVAIVQVTDTNISAPGVELRVLVSAGNSSKLWDLRVAVREGLMRYLREHEPDALPHSRAIVDLSHSRHPGEAPTAGANA